METVKDSRVSPSTVTRGVNTAMASTTSNTEDVEILSPPIRPRSLEGIDSVCDTPPTPLTPFSTPPKSASKASTVVSTPSTVRSMSNRSIQIHKKRERDPDEDDDDVYASFDAKCKKLSSSSTEALGVATRLVEDLKKEKSRLEKRCFQIQAKEDALKAAQQELAKQQSHTRIEVEQQRIVLRKLDFSHKSICNKLGLMLLKGFEGERLALEAEKEEFARMKLQILKERSPEDKTAEK